MDRQWVSKPTTTVAILLEVPVSVCVYVCVCVRVYIYIYIYILSDHFDHSRDGCYSYFCGQINGLYLPVTHV